MTGTVISYPIPAYSNVEIEPQFYQPSRFVISAITRGSTTTVTTSTDHNYVIGQLVRLLVPSAYGIGQINNQEGYVISVPSSTQVVVVIDSSRYSAFNALISPSTITDIQSFGYYVTITTVNGFVAGSKVSIASVVGMTQINGITGDVTAASSSKINVNIQSFCFSAYVSGGTVTLVSASSVPQILAIGDVNQGATNASGRSNQGLYPLGAFINISPQ